MKQFADFLQEEANLNHYKTAISHLAKVLVIGANPKRQVLINGLIALVLGAYSLNSKKISELTTDTIRNYLKLL